MKNIDFFLQIMILKKCWAWQRFGRIGKDQLDSLVDHQAILGFEKLSLLSLDEVWLFDQPVTCRASAAAAAAAAAPAAPAAAPAAHHFWHEEAIKLEEPIIESKYTVKEKTPHTVIHCLYSFIQWL